MKSIFLIKIFLTCAFYATCQDTSKIKAIDSIVKGNKENVKTIYQLERKAVLEAMHDRYPIKDAVYVLKYNASKVLVEVIEISKAGSDTEIIVHNYFNDEKVIKIHCIWKWSYYNTDSIHVSEDIVYVDNSKVVFVSSTNKKDMRYDPDTYFNRADRIMKRIKKKRLRFPL